MVTRNLNKIIDVNFYPVETARRSNLRHRPIGLGVQVSRPVTARGSLRAPLCLSAPTQGLIFTKPPAPPYCAILQGLADTFLLLGMPFDSPQAAELNRQIFETIYFAALRTSMQLAKTEGGWPASANLQAQHQNPWA